jgi:hypothetical protein
VPDVNRSPRRITAVVAILGVAGCARIATPYDDLPQLGVGAHLRLENLCAGGKSPAIAITRLPPGAARYKIKLTNMSVLWQQPREWTIPLPAEPTQIPAGALRDYAGPCPGEFQRFTYRLETVALSDAGNELAHGAAFIVVESVNRQAREQWRRGGTPRSPADDDVFGRDADFRDPFPIGRDQPYDPFLDRRLPATSPRRGTIYP